MGAGHGLWAGLLRKTHDVEVKAFDLGAWDGTFAASSDSSHSGDGLDGTIGRFGSVTKGGPEALKGLGAECNALVLMWPDYQGVGSYGLECARRWTLEEKGKRMICVGEWSVADNKVPLVP